MQKLVSKSPIQRFKQGKKIVKMQHGTPGKSSNEKFANWLSSIGPKIFSVKPTGSGLLGWINGTSSNQQNNSPVEQKQGQSSTIKSATIGPSPLSNKQKIIKKSGVDKNGNSIKWNEDGNGNFISGQYVSDDGNTYWQGSDGSKTLIKKGNPKTVDSPKTITKRPINSSMFLAKQGGWNRNIGLGNINDQESKDILDKLGWKGKTAEQVQQLLNNNNIGGYAVNVDNKWGNQSKDALKKYYERYLKEQQINPPTDPVAINLDQAYQAQKPSNQPSAFPKIEMPYTSTGTYNQGQSRILKDLGIRDYSSLVNYVNTNPGSSISSDLTQRFGNTSNWNQQNVENEIGIGGHYGRMNRNSLWGYLGGLKNKYNQDYARKLGMMMLGYNKQGGQLVSRNPINRFKNKQK